MGGFVKWHFVFRATSLLYFILSKIRHSFRVQELFRLPNPRITTQLTTATATTNITNKEQTDSTGPILCIFTCNGVAHGYQVPWNIIQMGPRLHQTKMVGTEGETAKYWQEFIVRFDFRFFFFFYYDKIIIDRRIDQLDEHNHIQIEECRFNWYSSQRNSISTTYCILLYTYNVELIIKVYTINISAV